MKKVECLDYRQLPRQDPLFLKYLYDYQEVSSLYSSPVHLSLDHLKDSADQILKNPPPYPRDRLVHLLSEFNQKIRAGEPTFTNLEKLKSPRTVAVMTGHQLGFLGGPAFTVYKAVTAICVARLLDQEGYCAVPVFWLASDDSDFQEIRSSTFRDRDGKLFSLSYPGPQENSPRMVGTMSLDAVEECLKTLEERGIKGGFQSETMNFLRETYASGRSFREALGAWLARLFHNDGLILFDALSQYKRDAKPLFRVAIEKRQRLLQALKQRGDLLRKKGFDPQVRTADSESLLFWVEGDKRYKLECEEKEYVSRTRKSVKFSQKQLLDELEQRAERLGPNVLLRPILQDYLFPTVTYVGGPSEVAYFSQIASISGLWDREVPVLPRIGFTVVDRKAQRLLNKYQLKVLDVINDSPDKMTEKILARSDSAEVLSRFERLRSRLREDLDLLQTQISELDPPVAEMLGRAD
jgi:bacillithiol synthase